MLTITGGLTAGSHSIINECATESGTKSRDGSRDRSLDVGDDGIQPDTAAQKSL